MLRRPGYALTVIVIIVGLFVIFVRYGRAADYRIPNECAALASRYGVPDVVGRREARRLTANLDRYINWPGVRECRNAAKRDWGM